MNSWHFVGSYYSFCLEEIHCIKPLSGIQLYAFITILISLWFSWGSSVSTMGLQVSLGDSAPQMFILGSRQIGQLLLMAHSSHDNGRSTEGKTHYEQVAQPSPWWKGKKSKCCGTKIQIFTTPAFSTPHVKSLKR